MATLLDQLRGLSAVDCDTLDVDVAAKLGPFADCTSNQAIVFSELSRANSDGTPFHSKLIHESYVTAHWMFAKQSDATLYELVVEIATVGLSLRFAPYLSGFCHVQTNPKWCFSTQKTIKNAERIVSHFKQLSPDFDTSRVCIKIPATWEGLQACRELEKRGIATLATTVFCMEQAALAAEVECRYIAPYVNELRVHFDPAYVDTDKGFPLCAAAQHYFEGRQLTTLVMPASLVSIDEVMQLAGAQHITVSPPLLAELAATPATGWHGAGSVGQVMGHAAGRIAGAEGQYDAVVKDEGRWKLALTRSDGGKSMGKLVQAINIFCDVQDKVEDLVKRLNPI
ncbi:hypothetical protein B0T19DRAFT_435560 [Cercophora scortea]|uniref:Transaldolase n=1 Tax=Cercophora scortea TaxID=314031 RepID=A0AAE0M3X0_9PEZI|nr:hypothetical protein B0T19DRAFT_435560 [Cercophora scortea]